MNKIKFDHITPLLKELKWLDMERKLIKKLAILVFKVLRTGMPHPLRSKLTIYNPTRELRSSQSTCTTLVLGSTISTRGKAAWEVTAPSMWNSLPENARENNISMRKFLHRLSVYLFSLE
jgi:DNA primase